MFYSRLDDIDRGKGGLGRVSEESYRLIGVFPEGDWEDEDGNGGSGLVHERLRSILTSLQPA